MKLWTSVAAFAALCLCSVRADTATVQPYTCETDADCDKSFTNTVCITVDYYDGVKIKKCTPNTKARPACRGGTPGICPSYQSADIGYLNLQCVFVAADGATVADGSGSGGVVATVTTAGATRRYLVGEAGMANATTAVAATTKPTTTTAAVLLEGSATGDNSTTVGDGSAAGLDDLPGPAYKPDVTVKINKQTVRGSFQCVDVSDCPTKAYDPESCLPKECGPTGSLEQCNTHGTCTYKSLQTMNRRSCVCQKGFSGEKCQTEISGACDVDCGFGGDCVDGQCKCKKGFDGKSYKGKAGKPNRRCSKCTNDQACQNGNPCDIESGACVCNPGYAGPTCGATEDGCTKMTCGVGNCQVSKNGTGVCMCPHCFPECQLCPTKDCSTCPSAAIRLEASSLTLLITAIVTLLMSYSAL